MSQASLKITNLTRGTVIAGHAPIADTFFSRLIGLLNRSSLPEGEGLVITRCQSIHMLFMRFSIDAIFADKANAVVGLVRGLKPFRLSPFFGKAAFAVELPVQTIEKSQTRLGDTLQIEAK